MHALVLYFQSWHALHSGGDVRAVGSGSLPVIVGTLKKACTPAHRQLLLALAEWLCAEHASDARAARMTRDMHLFLMPSMNPDGFEARSRGNARRVRPRLDDGHRIRVLGLRVFLTMHRRLAALWTGLM